MDKFYILQAIYKITIASFFMLAIVLVSSFTFVEFFVRRNNDELLEFMVFFVIIITYLYIIFFQRFLF